MDYMEVAIKEAKKGIKNKDGGPFGAVIVRKNKVVSKSHNLVLKSNDPTAHAEINAIRKASKKLKKFDLSDCELYTTCEPCPMCYFAIHWAKIKTVYFGATRIDAAKIGFSDKDLYDIFKGKKSYVKLIKKDSKDCVAVMSDFTKLKGKLY